MSLRTPLGKARGLGSAKDGTHHFWVQRLTAIALIPLTIWFVAALVSLTGAGHGEVTEWLRKPIPAILMLLLVVSGMYHLKLGLQVIVEDYVHSEGLKLTGQIAIILGCAAIGFAAAFSILKISLGS